MAKSTRDVIEEVFVDDTFSKCFLSPVTRRAAKEILWNALEVASIENAKAAAKPAVKATPKPAATKAKKTIVRTIKSATKKRAASKPSIKKAVKAVKAASGNNKPRKSFNIFKKK